jgi:hypothetical protein
VHAAEEDEGRPMEAFVQQFAACLLDMDGTLCVSRDHFNGPDQITAV